MSAATELEAAGGPLPALVLAQVLTVVRECAVDGEAAETAVAARIRVELPPGQEAPALGLPAGGRGVFLVLQPAAALRLIAEVAAAREAAEVVPERERCAFCTNVVATEPSPGSRAGWCLVEHNTRGGPVDATRGGKVLRPACPGSGTAPARRTR